MNRSAQALSRFSPQRLDWARDGADWPLSAASRFVEAGGLRWHVQVLGEAAADGAMAGAQPRPVALLIHGAGGACHSWRGVAPLLARDFTVIAPDLPGHGFSEPPPRGGYSLPAMAASLAALLRALGAAPGVAVGHSAGAAVAARMALDGMIAPRVIVAFNGAFLPFKGVAGAVFPAMARLLALNPLAARAMAWSADRDAVERLLGGVGGALDAQGRALYRRLFSSPGHVAAALGMMAAWDLGPLGRDLRRLRTPLELVVGEADRAVPPADARIVADRAPRAHVRALAGLGHLAHEERPDAAAKIVRDAFAAHAPEAAAPPAPAD